jgi:hypothetical protein
MDEENKPEITDTSEVPDIKLLNLLKKLKLLTTIAL